MLYKNCRCFLYLFQKFVSLNFFWDSLDLDQGHEVDEELYTHDSEGRYFAARAMHLLNYFNFPFLIEDCP